VTKRRDARGFSMLEALIGLTVLLLAMTAVAGMLIQSSRINKKQRMNVQVQADARNCLSMIVQRLRSAGWDPHGVDFDAVSLDSDSTDSIDEIEIRADLNDDGDIDDDFEQLLIRHRDDQIEWRKTSAGSFEILAINISNDSDGDGNTDPMFTADGNPPTRITVSVTAQSPQPDPVTREFIRYTVSSDVVLRDAL